MKKNDFDQRFVGLVRTNTGPISIAVGPGMLEGMSYTIPSPDKQLSYELSLAFQSYIRRKDKLLKHRVK